MGVERKAKQSRFSNASGRKYVRGRPVLFEGIDFKDWNRNVEGLSEEISDRGKWIEQCYSDTEGKRDLEHEEKSCISFLRDFLVIRLHTLPYLSYFTLSTSTFYHHGIVSSSKYCSLLKQRTRLSIIQ